MDLWLGQLINPAARLLVMVVAAASVTIGYGLCLWIKPHPPALSANALAIINQDHLHNRRVFNEYSLGGYLISQHIPVIVDGRADMYGDAFLEDYLAMFDPNHLYQLQDYLDHYQVEWTLLSSKNYLVGYLDHDAHWKKIYSDEYCTIHQRVKN